MRALALSLLLLTACPKSPEGTGPAPRRGAPAVEMPVDPAAEGPAAAPSPPLGTAAEMDIEAMARSRTTYTLTADVAAVQSITPELAPLLAHHLAADAAWKLSREAGSEIAVRRGPLKDAEAVGVRGYQGTPVDAHKTIWRVAIRFGPAAPGSPWLDAPGLATQPATDKKFKLIQLGLGSQDWPGWNGVALAVEGPAIRLELHEVAEEPELQRMASALSKVPVSLTQLVQLSGVQGVEYLPGWLARGSITTDGHSLALEPAADGRLTVQGRLNPGQAGWTFARILGPDGQPWEDQTVGLATLERVGWSADPAQAFLFASRIQLATAPPEGSTVEAWFAPLEGGAPRRIWPTEGKR